MLGCVQGNSGDAGMKSRAIAWGLLAMLALPAWAGESQSRPEVGEIPPQQLGRQFGGDKIDLGQYRGKVIIVTFWASWCGPCRQELPVLAHFRKVVGSDALEVIAINYKEPRDDFQSVVRANRGKFEMVYVHDSGGSVSGQYGVKALPNMFIIDRDGKIAARHMGYSAESLPGFVQEIIALLPEEIRNRPARGS